MDWRATRAYLCVNEELFAGVRHVNGAVDVRRRPDEGEKEETTTENPGEGHKQPDDNS
jgi:hypothetical protein